jgi:hypothetical protein
MLPVFPPLHQGLVGGTGGAAFMENTSEGKKLSRERSLQRRACKPSPGIACIAPPDHPHQNEYSKERRGIAFLRSMTAMKGFGPSSFNACRMPVHEGIRWELFMVVPRAASRYD